MLTLVLATLLVRRPLVVGYVQNWNPAPRVDYDRLTHLNVAFENPVDDAGTLSFNPLDAALVRAGHAHGVKVLVSLGGAGSAETPALRTRLALLLRPENREAFVGKLARFVAEHGFDGLDVDLEGAAIDENYAAFVRILGIALHREGRLMTAALALGNGGDRVGKATLAAFDLVNVMAYDATGPWDPAHPGPHASLAFAKASVEGFLARGVPRARLVLGVPFYGHGFGPAAKEANWTYAKIVATYPGAERSDRAGDVVWYNGVPTIRAKAAYIRAEGLAGAMIWSVDQDVPGADSLLAALDAGLRRGR